MRDLQDLLPHLSRLNEVRGGSLLVREGFTVLTLEEMEQPRLRGARPLRPGIATTRHKGPGGVERTRHTANSAEGVRSLKEALGVPSRPTREPVDVWARRSRQQPPGGP